ncbi:probable asparagine--tRNA ligase, mitochondrial [Diorhabda carinulata]|uniref:probable asparagine--tRNA ligase, mitochondrial n=1 Tax=Diorhabda carinulata TaxID=1163345 RepID=UPI0025A24091|nr:probable asparagine--tRNA ligase, mitochondrial [Diorhabda carinulata]
MFVNLFKHSIKTQVKQQTTNYSYTIHNILESVDIGQEIKIKGWIKSLRKQKDNVFLDISDGSTAKKLQIIIPNNIVPKNLTTGASITTQGILQTSPKGQKEINANKIKIFNNCIVTDGYPFAPRKKYLPDYVRQYLHFRPRTNKFSSVLRTRSTAQLCFHDYLTNKGYINVQTPVLTSNDCEGAGEIFRVVPESQNLLKSMVKQGEPIEEAFFNKKSYLTVSGQLHLEAAAHGLSKVYNLGPTFRAENSKSRLHLAEFYMLEAEIAFIEELDALTTAVEELVKDVTKLVVEKCQDDLDVCRENTIDCYHWLNKSFVTLEYDEAEDILKKNKDKFERSFRREIGISKEQELFLVQHCGNVPTFIINWPKDIKPFYMKESEDDPSKVLAFDLLVPGVGEMVGGSLREDNIEKLKRNLSNDQLDWYIDLRRFGGVPSAGYGLGFERYLLFLTGIQNIKDVIPFPRWPHNCSM